MRDADVRKLAIFELGLCKKCVNKLTKEELESLLRKVEDKKIKRMKRLTKEGKEYQEQFGFILDFEDEGFERDDIVQAINTCAKMNSMDAGDDIGLFLSGMEYQKLKHRGKDDI